MQKKIFSMLLLASVITAGAFAFFNKTTFRDSFSETAETETSTANESKPEQQIEGVWVIDNYSFDVLDDRAKGTNTNLEQRKASKAKHYFIDGKSWVNDKQSPVVYGFRNNKIYLWSPDDVSGINTLNDEVISAARTQAFTYNFQGNKMKLAMSNEFFNMEIVFIKSND